jgi:hypothetical protein
MAETIGTRSPSQCRYNLKYSPSKYLLYLTILIDLTTKSLIPLHHKARREILGEEKNSKI